MCFAYCINFVGIKLRIDVLVIITAIGHLKDFSIHKRTRVEDRVFTYHMSFLKNCTSSILTFRSICYMFLKITSILLLTVSICGTVNYDIVIFLNVLFCFFNSLQSGVLSGVQFRGLLCRGADQGCSKELLTASCSRRSWGVTSCFIL